MKAMSQRETSRRQMWAFGACGELARRTGMDATLLRVGLAVLTLAWGLGLLLYIALAVLFAPGSENRSAQTTSTLLERIARLKTHQKNTALALLLVGLVVTMTVIGAYSWLGWGRFLAIGVVIAGAFVALGRPESGRH